MNCTGARKRIWRVFALASLALVAAVLPGVDASAAANAQDWTQLGADIVGQGPNEWLGDSVGISADGTIVAVAADRAKANGQNAGQVRVYQYDGADLVQLGSDINGERYDSRLGLVVDLSADGQTLAVSEIGEDGVQVTLLQWNGSDWTPLGDPVAGPDGFGLVELSADGSTVLTRSVVDRMWTYNTYRFDGSQWAQIGARLSGFTLAAAINGTGDRIAFGNLVGEIEFFDYDGADWIPAGILSDAVPFDGLGLFEMTPDGSTILATDRDAPTGLIYAYRLSGGAWSSLGVVATNFEGENDYASSIALSDDGNTAVVATKRALAGKNGQVRVHAFDGANWNQVGSDLNGDNARDNFGGGIAVDAAGDNIVVGGPGFGDGADDRTGRARLYGLVATCQGVPVTIDMTAGDSGVGTAGRDVVLGTSGADVINTGDGDDLVCAGAGADIIRTGAGEDRIFAGDGDDQIWAGDDDDRVTAGDGDDTVRGGSGNDRLLLQMGDDIAYGGSGNDLIQGGAGNDQLFGRAGDDVLAGQAGNDVLEGDNGDDACDGGAGSADSAASSCETVTRVP